MRKNYLFIANAGKKGKGVFTQRDIPTGTVVEIAPVIVLKARDRKRCEDTKLYYYIFEWGNKGRKGAIGLGYVSMYNHASPATCEYEMNYEDETISVIVMRDVLAGEELTINYSAGWDDWKPVWFDTEE